MARRPSGKRPHRIGNADKGTEGVLSDADGAPDKAHSHKGDSAYSLGNQREGQRVYAEAGETPAHPNVEPLEKVRPAAAYMLSIDEVKEFPKYEKLWKESFQIR